MKTTIELPDDLLIAAKRRAAETRSTLKTLFERGLRRELSRSSRRAKSAGQKVRWVTVPGGLAKGLDVADREKMHEYLRAHDRD